MGERGLGAPPLNSAKRSCDNELRSIRFQKYFTHFNFILLLTPPRSDALALFIADRRETFRWVGQLIDAGATFYGASWCGFTKKQLAELNITEADPRGLDYVDCNSQEELCAQKGIEAFPTWQLNGKLFPGYYPPAKLAELLTKSA
eukprot:1147794-Prymnesium_polylepis.1